MELKIQFEQPVKDEKTGFLMPELSIGSIGLFGLEGDKKLEIHFNGAGRQVLLIEAASQRLQAAYEELITAALEESKGEWTEKRNSNERQRIADAKAKAKADAEEAARAAEAAKQPKEGENR